MQTSMMIMMMMTTHPSTISITGMPLITPFLIIIHCHHDNYFYS